MGTPTKISRATSSEMRIAAPGLVPLQRLYNGVTNEHLYTTSAEEAQGLQSQGFTIEASAYCYVAPGETDDLKPLYRLYHPSPGQLYEDTGDQVISSGTYMRTMITFYATGVVVAQVH